MIYVVKVHCGNAHVSGKARGYRYYVASLFCAEGKYFKNTGTSTYPRRSERLCRQDGIELARRHNCMFMEGYGSLHNKSVGILDTEQINQIIKALP